MAKRSKKTASPLTPFDIADFAGLLDEGMDGAPAVKEAEPLVHIPNVDIFSTSGKLIIEVEMPGVKKEDIEINLSGCTIKIKAMKLEYFEDSRVKYICMERLFGRIYRSIDLPFTVNTASIRAAYKSGILTITAARIKDKRSSSMRIPIESEDNE